MYYANVGLSELEIPNEKSLVIYISECQNCCKNCHTPYLQKKYGDYLKDNFDKFYNIYKNYITCVCFMGEGKENIDVKNEFKYYCNIIHSDNLKTALYSGRDCDIEEWMNIFDYIKLGSFQEDRGSLNSKYTNQILYKKIDNYYKDITNLFWK